MYFSLVFYFCCLTDSPSPSLPRTEQRPGSATLHRGEKGGQAGGEQNLHHFFLTRALTTIWFLLLLLLFILLYHRIALDFAQLRNDA